MVTCVPGHNDCTASASTWAASCRISSKARASSRAMNSIFASCSIGSARSVTTPSSAIATVRLASEGEMPLAMSSPVVSLGNSRVAPSGKVSAILLDSTGFRLLRLYLKSVIEISCGSLLRTSAGKLGSSGIAGDSHVAIRQAEQCREKHLGSLYSSARTCITCVCMKNQHSDSDVHRHFAPTALMLGNLVTGCSVLAPTGMLSELSSGLDVTIRDAGLLITFGAIVLCIGSPLTAWLTSRIDRRTLLTATLAVLALANIASALAPDYINLLVIRLIMLSVSALYTPQAAGTAALIVPPEKRGGTVAYIFLGWSLAAAICLQLVTFIARRVGWRATYDSIGVGALFRFLLLVWRLT